MTRLLIIILKNRIVEGWIDDIKYLLYLITFSVVIWQENAYVGVA